MLSLQLPTDAGHDGYETQKGWNVGICYCHFFLNSSKFQTKVPNKHKDASVKTAAEAVFLTRKLWRQQAVTLGREAQIYGPSFATTATKGRKIRWGTLGWWW